MARQVDDLPAVFRTAERNWEDRAVEAERPVFYSKEYGAARAAEARARADAFAYCAREVERALREGTAASTVTFDPPLRAGLVATITIAEVK